MIFFLNINISFAIVTDSLNLRWKFSLAQQDEIIINHFISEATCYIASDKAIYAIDLSSGKEIWKYYFNDNYIPSVPTFYIDFCCFALYPKFPYDSIFLKVLASNSGAEITSLSSKQDVYKVPVIIKDSSLYFITGKTNKRTELYYMNKFDEVILNSYSINQRSYNWTRKVNDNMAELLSVIDDFVILSQNNDYKYETPANELFFYSVSNGQQMKKYKSKYSIIQPLINEIIDLDESLPYYLFSGPLVIDLIDKQTWEKYSQLPICGTGIHYFNDSIFVYTIVDIEDVYAVYWSVINKEKGKSTYYKKAYKYTNIASLVTKVLASTFSNLMDYYTTYYNNPVLEIFLGNNNNNALQTLSADALQSEIDNLYRTFIPTKYAYSNLCVDNMVTDKYFISLYKNNKNITCLSVMTKKKKRAKTIEFQITDIKQKPYLLKNNNDNSLLITGDGRIEMLELESQKQSILFKTDDKDAISLGLILSSDNLLLFTMNSIFCFNANF